MEDPTPTTGSINQTLKKIKQAFVDFMKRNEGIAQESHHILEEAMHAADEKKIDSIKDTIQSM